MLQNFQTVGSQILAMLCLILVGILCRKQGFLHGGTVKDLADVMLYLVTPSVIVKSFQRPFDRALLGGFFLSAGAAVAAHAFAMLLAILCFRQKEEAGRRVLRFGTVFSNCGFMAIPLLEAVLGEEGVFYGAAYLAVFNLLVWTAGVWMMAGDKGAMSVKKILLHPGILCVAVGLLLFFASVSLPSVLYRPLEFLSFLNTPIPMLLIGYYIAEVNWGDALKKGGLWLLCLLRLLVVPVGLLFGMYFLGIRGNLLVAAVVSASAPTATISTMFAAKYDGDAVFSAQTVSVSTLFSLLTMPLLIALALSLAA